MSGPIDPVLRIPETVREDVLGFRGQLRRFEAGAISPVAFRALRVPMGIYEQRTSGAYMVRIRVGAGLLLPAQLRRAASIAAARGDGRLHVTTRQDLQIHGVALRDLPDVLEELLGAGLTSRGGGGNTVRNVTACPRSGDCPDEAFDVAPHAIALAEFFLPHRSSYNLPRKFKIAFSCGPSDCAAAAVNDLGFLAEVRDGVRGFGVLAGGGLGPHPRAGVRVEAFVPEARIFEVAEAVRRLFDAEGDRANRHRARLRYVLERLGPEGFVAGYRRHREAVVAEGAAANPPSFRDLAARFPRPPAEGPAGEPLPPSALSERDPRYRTLRLRLLLGNLTADGASRVAEVAESHGRGLIRTTPLQGLLIPGIPAGQVAAALEALGDLRPDPASDALPAIVACAGATTCRLGLCNSPDLARSIGEELRRTGAGPGAASLVVRISGCPNSCGNHPLADIGLEGLVRRHGDRLVPCYTVLAGGRVHGGSATLAQRLGAVPARLVPGLLAEALAGGPPDPERLRSLVAARVALPDPLPEELCRDAGSDRPFSLAGRGPGECGAGVLDVIRVDLDESKRFLKEVAVTSDDAAASGRVYGAVLAAARALLVVFGLEPKKDREVLDAFRLKMVGPGWVRADTAELLDAALDWRLGDRTSLAGLAGRAGDLVERVEALFLSLDANLSFRLAPVMEAAAAPAAPPADVPAFRADLRGVACPMNFVKAKVALEKVPAGGVLEILLDDGEPIRNVPASLAEQGHRVIESVRDGDHHRLRVRRAT